MRTLAKFMQDPMLRVVNLDGPERFEVHRAMLEKKPLVRHTFNEIKRLLHGLNERFLTGEGIELEIGAGVAPLKELYPQILATDLVDGPRYGELNAR